MKIKFRVELSHIYNLTCFLATLMMEVSETDVPPTGYSPSACQAARCHCPLFQGGWRNKLVKTTDFLCGYRWKNKHSGKQKATMHLSAW